MVPNCILSFLFTSQYSHGQFPSTGCEGERLTRASSETHAATASSQTAAPATSQANNRHSSIDMSSHSRRTTCCPPRQQERLCSPGCLPTDGRSIARICEPPQPPPPSAPPDRLTTGQTLALLHQSGAVTGTGVERHRCHLHTCSSWALFVQNITPTHSGTLHDVNQI